MPEITGRITIEEKDMFGWPFGKRIEQPVVPVAEVKPVEKPEEKPEVNPVVTTPEVPESGDEKPVFLEEEESEGGPEYNPEERE